MYYYRNCVVIERINDAAKHENAIGSAVVV